MSTQKTKVSLALPRSNRAHEIRGEDPGSQEEKSWDKPKLKWQMDP